MAHSLQSLKSNLPRAEVTEDRGGCAHRSMTEVCALRSFFLTQYRRAEDRRTDRNAIANTTFSQWRIFGWIWRWPLLASCSLFLRTIYRHSAWTSDARPEGTLTLKQCSRVHQNTPFSFIRTTPSMPTALRPSRLCRSTHVPFQIPKYAAALCFAGRCKQLTITCTNDDNFYCQETNFI